MLQEEIVEIISRDRAPASAEAVRGADCAQVHKAIRGVSVQ